MSLETKKEESVLSVAFFISSKIDLLRNNDSKRNEENLSENGEARGSPIKFDKATSDKPFAAKFSNCSRSAYCATGLLDKIQFAIVSFGGVGFIRPASATWGSLAAGILLYFIYPPLPFYFKLALIVLIFTLGVFLADHIEKKHNVHDPHFIVIDEVVGMLIVCFFLQPVMWHFGLAFLLFRVFDIAKLWPASIFDARKGGFSLMFDDVLMALPALGSLHLIIYLVEKWV